MHLSKLNIYSCTLCILVQVGQIPMDVAVEKAYDAVLDWTFRLVDALERFYGTVLEGVLMKQEVNAFLLRVSNKVNLIPGCLIAIINLENASKLVELLKMLHYLTVEIRKKVFDYVAEQLKKFHEKLLIDVDSETRGTVEEIFDYIANKAYVMINLRQLDMINFLKDNGKALNIVIQIRIVSAHTTSSKTSVKEPTQFILAFNGHAQVENTLREDPVDNAVPQVCLSFALSLLHIFLALFVWLWSKNFQLCIFHSLTLNCKPEYPLQ